MRAILEVGAARFILEGHSFESFCREVVHTLSPLVSVDAQTICLGCSLEAFVSQAVSEEELIAEAERAEALTRRSVADRRHSAATAHRVLSGRRFSHLSATAAAGSTDALGILQQTSVRVGRGAVAAAQRLYLYSQETFESIESLLALLAEEARERESRMLALGLLSAPRETPTACVLPTVVLDTLMSTSAPVAPYYDANGQPCRRRSLPTSHEDAVAAAVARQSQVAPLPPHDEQPGPADGPDAEAVPLPSAVKAQLEQQSYASYLRALVKPTPHTSPSHPHSYSHDSNPVHVLAVQTIPVDATQGREAVTAAPLPVSLPHHHTVVRDGTAGLMRSPHRSGVCPPPPDHHPLPQETHSAPPRTAPPGMPPLAPQSSPPQPPTHRAAESAERHSTTTDARYMAFQKGVRVDVAELVTGKPSRPTSAVASAPPTAQSTPRAPPTQPMPPPASSLPSPDPSAVRSALGAYPLHRPAASQTSDWGRTAGNTSLSVASSSTRLSGMRTPMPGLSVEERGVVDRLLQVDDMTPIRRTPVMLRSMPIIGASTNVDVTAATLLPVAEGERHVGSSYRALGGNPAAQPVNHGHPYSSSRGAMRPRGQSAPSAAAAGRVPPGTYNPGALPRISSAPRGGLETRDASRAGTGSARAHYNQLFSLTPVSDKYARLLREA